jgi:hypothetical protein
MIHRTPLFAFFAFVGACAHPRTENEVHAAYARIQQAEARIEQSTGGGQTLSAEACAQTCDAAHEVCAIAESLVDEADARVRCDSGTRRCAACQSEFEHE